MRRINVLICITKLELGGAQQGTVYLAKHLDREKFRLVFVSSPGELNNEVIGMRDAKIMLLNSFKREIDLRQDWRAFKELKQIIIDEKIDIIHTNSSKAGILGRLAGWRAKVPVIIHTVHGWPFHDYMSSKKKKLYVWLEKMAARVTTKIVPVAQANVVKGLHEGIGEQAQYQVIRCGIEIDKFQTSTDEREDVLKEFNIPQDALVVGMIACFKPQKCPIDFVKVAGRIASQLDNAYFVLVGDGELRPDIEKMIKKQKIEKKFILTGWRRDVSRLLSAFDVLAHTSLWEGLPCVFSQAMAKGIPIVATNVDGAPEIIIGGLTGHLVLPHECLRMAEIIIRLLKNPLLREQMGKNAKQYVGPFDINLMVREYERLYLRLAAKHIRDIRAQA